MTSCYGIESGRLLYNRWIGVLFSDKRNKRMLRKGVRSKQCHQVNGLQVTKCDIFYSEIYYNTTNQRPQRIQLVVAVCRFSGALATAASPGQRQGSEKMGWLFQSFCGSMGSSLAGVYRILKHVSVQKAKSFSSGELLGEKSPNQSGEYHFL